jgi:uncharacterized membrane protein
MIGVINIPPRSGTSGPDLLRECLSKGRQDVSPVSKPSPWGGYTIPILIVFLGIVGLFDFIFFIAFLALLGYYLYRVEKRVTALEQGAGIRPQDPEQVKPPR